jgi:hypothetical protein
MAGKRGTENGLIEIGFIWDVTLNGHQKVDDVQLQLVQVLERLLVNESRKTLHNISVHLYRLRSWTELL